jgi:hypothetical protein
VRIEILDKAEDDLVNGFKFYEEQQPGLGAYFRENLSADIDSLRIHGGVHRMVYRNYHRALSKRLPPQARMDQRTSKMKFVNARECSRTLGAGLSALNDVHLSLRKLSVISSAVRVLLLPARLKRPGEDCWK